jgi:TolB-like protein/class 3 adenylate cyclase
MSAETKKEIQLEIAHVLFIDIVAYSKLSINEQGARIDELNEVVRASEQFQKDEASSRLIKIPTGDGMALVFYTSPEAPVRCAIELSRALKDHPSLSVRMGIHSGPVSGVIDVTGRANLAGAGLNMANRVMSCGDAGHILLSKHVAEDLGEYEQWRPLLHDLGICEMKHGVRIGVTNLYSDGVGNPELPKKFQALKKQRARVRLTVAATALLLLAAIVVTFVLVSKKSATSPTSIAPEKSIAVLPFENLSEEKANAYFATGIQDEILTRIAKIGALKVIARTSTQQYAARPGNLSEIARQLGVAHILEGAVQKAGDQVHINVQLIRAATDEHLWAESYDRKLENIFGVEAEVATAVAEALKAKLTGAEQNAVQEKSTNNAAAYDAYLRGLAYSLRPNYSSTDNLDAIKYFGEAVKLDPKFALAWAWLGYANALGYFNRITDNVTTLREAAKRAADTATDLQPNLSEACQAQGYFYYYCDLDYDRAIASFEKAGQLSPNNSRILSALGLVCRRKGQWERGLNYFRQAIELDPRNVALLGGQVNVLWDMRQYQAALKAYGRVLDIIPGDVSTLAQEAGLYQVQGDLAAAAAVLAPLHLDLNSAFFFRQIDQWIYERRYGDAIQAVKTAVTNPRPDDTAFMRFDYKAQLAWLQQLSGDTGSARTTWQQVESDLEALHSVDSENVFVIQYLAWANAALGNKAKALALAERANELEPFSKDAAKAADTQQWLARIAAQTGESKRALSILEYSAQIPGGVHYGDLKLDPVWDSLRGDPRFEKIVGSLKPK